MANRPPRARKNLYLLVAGSPLWMIPGSIEQEKKADGKWLAFQ
jgi:hypothetical protein